MLDISDEWNCYKQSLEILYRGIGSLLVEEVWSEQNQCDRGIDLVQLCRHLRKAYETAKVRLLDVLEGQLKVVCDLKHLFEIRCHLLLALRTIATESDYDDWLEWLPDPYFFPAFIYNAARLSLHIECLTHLRKTRKASLGFQLSSVAKSVIACLEKDSTVWENWAALVSLLFTISESVLPLHPSMVAIIREQSYSILFLRPDYWYDRQKMMETIRPVAAACAGLLHAFESSVDYGYENGSSAGTERSSDPSDVSAYILYWKALERILQETFRGEKIDLIYFCSERSLLFNREQGDAMLDESKMILRMIDLQPLQQLRWETLEDCGDRRLTAKKVFRAKQTQNFNPAMSPTAQSHAGEEQHRESDESSSDDQAVSMIDCREFCQY